jgi:hypothetical protein
MQVDLEHSEIYHLVYLTHMHKDYLDDEVKDNTAAHNKLAAVLTKPPIAITATKRVAAITPEQRAAAAVTKPSAVTADISKRAPRRNPPR